MFKSYAQNFEDVYLYRLFGHLTSGTYVDVGAWMPDQHSVTKALYDRGWSGINIEPSTECLVLLKAERQRDINLGVVVADHSGEVDFHVVAGSGLSSVSVDNANRAVDIHKFVYETRRIHSVTLNSIWRDYVANRTVHFLKIDVEGSEEVVLRGMDFALNRPLVVIVEAVLPNERTERYENWEHLLLSGEYIFAMFDGINRWYVAAEHAELVDQLRIPVNLFDNFVRASDEALVQIEAELTATRESGEPIADRRGTRKPTSCCRCSSFGSRTSSGDRA
jgi:FkbM family methyltransferase